MHRSGTSFVASALEAAGLPMGERLLTNFPGNPRGHYEDIDFVTLHEEALAHRPEGSFITSDSALALGEELGARLDALIAARSGLAVWGCKDPRTTLFLDDWHRRLTHPLYVFVYRHPLEVLTSILRRGINPDVLAIPALGLQVWRAYNERVLAFHAAHQEVGLLASIDAIAADIPTFVAEVGARLQLPLDGGRAAERFHQGELERLVIGERVEELLRKVVPEVSVTLARLDDVADLPRPRRTAAEPTGIELLETLASEPSAPRLELLLAVVAPETWSDVPVKLLASIRALEAEQKRLGSEWDRQKRYIEGQSAHVSAQSDYIATLETQRAQLSSDLARVKAGGWVNRFRRRR